MEIALTVGFTVLLLVALAALLQVARDILLPSRMVTITVNGDRRLESWTNQKLLDALTGAGIPLPSACAGAGTCGLCRVTAPGIGETLPTERALLSRQELKDGTRLACQVVVRQPIEVTLPEDILDVSSFQCAVLSSVSLTPLIKEIVLQPSAATEFDFTPGGFVQVTAPPYRLDYSAIMPPEYRAHWEKLGLLSLSVHSNEAVSRAYSVASRPKDKGLIVLNIRLATPPPARPNAMPGIVSSWLFGCKTGDEIAVAGPYGQFGASDTDREMVFIGGGVGMAPLRAIIHHQLETRKSERKISYWYGARSRGEFFYADEFEALATKHSNFSWTPALSEPMASDNWTGATGFVHDVVFERYLKDHPAPESCEYYLCGPPLMIGAVYAMLDNCGVEARSIFNDDFGS